jgi:hypothetical protein
MPAASTTIVLALVCLASADPASAFLSGEQLLGRNKVKEARESFQAVAENPKAPVSLRAESELRLGCMAVEFDGQPPEAAKVRFARALQLFPKVSVPAAWNPTCLELLGAVRDEQRPAPPPKPGPRPGNVVDRAQLEKERQERVRLQKRLDALSEEMEAAKKKDEPRATTDPEARDRLARLEETIATMRVELKERDDRILAMSLKPDSPQAPAVQKPFDRRLTVPTIVFGALALGAAGTGLGFGLSTNASQSSFNRTTYQAEAGRFAREGTRSAIVADACFGGAIVLAATAVLVYFFQGPPAEARP